MPAPIAAAAAKGAQAASQTAVKGTAAVARTGGTVIKKGGEAATKGGSKAAKKGGQAATKGGSKATRQGARATVKAGTKTAQRGGRAATKGGATGTRPAGRAPGKAAGGSTRPGQSGPNTRAQRLLSSARGRQGPVGRGQHPLNAKARQGLNGGQQRTGRAKQALNAARGVGRANGRAARAARAGRTGEAQAPKSFRQRVKGVRQGYKRAGKLRHAWRNRPRFTKYGKDKKKRKEGRRKLRRVLMAAAAFQFLMLLVPVILIFFMVAGDVAPNAAALRQTMARPAALGGGLIPPAMLPQISELTGIPTCAPQQTPNCVPALESYSSAASAFGVDWTILAGIGLNECNHGRSTLPGCHRPTANFCGARGPMQFLGNTWRTGTDPVPSGDCPGSSHFIGNPIGPPIPEGRSGGYATDGNGDMVADPWEWLDATHAAARYLLANGLHEDVERAISRYNAKASYIANVIAASDRYREATKDLVTVPVLVGNYALPLDLHWYQEHPEWFTKPHHDYPAADIPVPYDTPVYAAASGTVTSAPTGGNCGLGITVDGDDGHEYIYCHGHDGGQLVRPGDRVEAGQLIMHVASTGNSTGNHLHFGIRVDGQDRCPQNLLVALTEGRTLNPASLPASGCSYSSA